MFINVNGVTYIHPEQLLQSLNIRVKLLTEKTAEPGRDSMTTELLRGQRLELMTLIKQIKEASNAT